MQANCLNYRDGEMVERIINPIVYNVKTEIDKWVQLEGQGWSII